jgi:hypothetical protein
MDCRELHASTEACGARESITRPTYVCPPAMILSRRQRHPKLFGCVAVGMLLNWLVLTLGIPLPSWSAKDRSRPFPCMDSVCGCHTAAKCWQSCCCHTNQEKLVWAKRNGVTPPAYVVAAAKKESKSNASSHSSCCTKKHPVAAPAEEPSAEKPSEESAGQIVLSSVRHCQGNASVSINSELATILVQTAPVLPAIPAVQWIELYDLSARSLDFTPASPPPQLG